MAGQGSAGAAGQGTSSSPHSPAYTRFTNPGTNVYGSGSRSGSVDKPSPTTQTTQTTKPITAETSTGTVTLANSLQNLLAGKGLQAVQNAASKTTTTVQAPKVATYDPRFGGVVTSTGEFYATSNPSFMPQGFTQGQGFSTPEGVYVAETPVMRTSAAPTSAVQGYTGGTGTYTAAPDKNVLQRIQQGVSTQFQRLLNIRPQEFGQNVIQTGKNFGQVATAIEQGLAHFGQVATAIEQGSAYVGQRVRQSGFGKISAQDYNYKTPKYGTMEYAFNPITKQLESSPYTQTTVKLPEYNPVATATELGVQGLAWMGPQAYITGASYITRGVQTLVKPSVSYGARPEGISDKDWNDYKSYVDQTNRMEKVSGALDVGFGVLPFVGKIAGVVKENIPRYGVSPEGINYLGRSYKEYKSLLEVQRLAEKTAATEYKLAQKNLQSEMKTLGSLQETEALRMSAAKKLGLDLPGIESPYKGVLKSLGNTGKGKGEISGAIAGAEPIGIAKGTPEYENALKAINEAGQGPQGKQINLAYGFDKDTGNLISKKLPFVPAPTSELRFTLSTEEVARRQKIRLLTGSLGDTSKTITSLTPRLAKLRPDMVDPLKFKVYTGEVYEQMGVGGKTRFSGQVLQIVKQEGRKPQVDYLTIAGRNKNALAVRLKSARKSTKDILVPGNIGYPIKVTKTPIAKVVETQAIRLEKPIEKTLFASPTEKITQRTYGAFGGTPYLTKMKGKVIQETTDFLNLFRLNKGQRRAIESAAWETKTATIETIHYKPKIDTLTIEGKDIGNKVMGKVSLETRQPYNIRSKSKTIFMNANEPKPKIPRPKEVTPPKISTLPKEKRTPWSTTFPKDEAIVNNKILKTPNIKEDVSIVSKVTPEQRPSEGYPSIVGGEGGVKAESIFAGGKDINGQLKFATAPEYSQVGKTLRINTKVSTAAPDYMIKSIAKNKQAITTVEKQLGMINVKAGLIGDLGSLRLQTQMNELKIETKLGYDMMNNSLIQLNVQEGLLIKPMVNNQVGTLDQVMSQQQEQAVTQVQLQPEILVKQMIMTVPRIVPRIVPRPKYPRPKLPEPKIKPTFDFDNNKKKKVLKNRVVKKKGPASYELFSRVKGKEKLIASRLTKQAALDIGTATTLYGNKKAGALSASLILKASSQKAVNVQTRGEFAKFGGLFREGKVKSKGADITLVQKEYYRLGTGQEKKAIQQARKKGGLFI